MAAKGRPPSSTSPERASRPDEPPADRVEQLRLIPAYDPFRGAADCWFDRETATLALDFFPEMLCHIEGDVAGRPFVLARWQKAFVANLFGWKRQDEH